MSGSLRVKSYTLGPFATNCYLIWSQGQPDAWIIDASFGPAPILRDVTQFGLTPSKLILTHTHVDHIAGVTECVSTIRAAGANPTLLVHPLERGWLTDPMLNLSAMSGQSVTTQQPDGELIDGQTLTIAGVDFTILHTPGHSPGGVSLHAPALDLLIAGDTLFAGSIGRTDFPGGDLPTLERSIRQRLYTLPPQTKVLAGHGPATTIGQERLTNPYVRA